MNWGLVLSNSAERVLRRAEQDAQRRLLFALDEIAADPYAGDVHLLKGLSGAFRKRVGNWRILFKLDHEQHLIVVTEIVRRGSHSY